MVLNKETKPNVDIGKQWGKVGSLALLRQPV